MPKSEPSPPSEWAMKRAQMAWKGGVLYHFGPQSIRMLNPMIARAIDEAVAEKLEDAAARIERLPMDRNTPWRSGRTDGLREAASSLRSLIPERNEENKT